MDTGRRVAVLGASVADALFGDRDPVGQQVTIAGVRFRVVGVSRRLGQSLGVDRDDEVHIPITTAQRLFGTQRVDGIAVKAPDRDRSTRSAAGSSPSWSDRHPDDRVQRGHPGADPRRARRHPRAAHRVLAAIAGISLLVGGVGVSNIMLVSVRERTREIGLRKAVGARPRDIAVQFLLEAVLLTTIGGVLGIGLGVGAALLVDRCHRCPRWSPGGRCCSPSGCRPRSASSSAWCRPSGPAGWTR